jgi:hypothetical protein
MTTSEAYKRTANRCAELAIACCARSVAAALLALALDYMTLADKLGQPWFREKNSTARKFRKPQAVGAI